MSAMTHTIPEPDRKGLRESGLVTGGILAGLFGLFFPWLLETGIPLWPWLVGAVLALWALNFDRQDAHNHARFLFREPVTVDGTTRKPSVLIQEGIGDTLVSNHMTRSLAWQLGPIPQLGPALVREPDLPEQFGPIQGNVDPQTTAAMAQYAPVGASVPPTPGCLAKNLTEGHFCAQRADESHAQRQRFFQSALVGVPVID